MPGTREVTTELEAITNSILYWENEAAEARKAKYIKGYNEATGYIKALRKLKESLMTTGKKTFPQMTAVERAEFFTGRPLAAAEKKAIEAGMGYKLKWVGGKYKLELDQPKRGIFKPAAEQPSFWDRVESHTAELQKQGRIAR